MLLPTSRQRTSSERAHFGNSIRRRNSRTVPGDGWRAICLPFIHSLLPSLPLPVYFFALNENTAKSFCHYNKATPHTQESSLTAFRIYFIAFTCNCARAGVESNAKTPNEPRDKAYGIVMKIVFRQNIYLGILSSYEKANIPDGGGGGGGA